MRTDKHDAANTSFSQFCERASQQEIKQENKKNANKEETWTTTTYYGMLS
jgi:hypothetical protein